MVLCVILTFHSDMQTSRPSFTQRNTERRSERRHKESGTRNKWKEENCNPTTSTSTCKHQYIFSSFSFLDLPGAARRAVTQGAPSFRSSLFFAHFRPRGCATRCPSMAYTLSCPFTNLRTSRPAFRPLDGSYTTNLPPFCRFLQTNGDMS